MKITLVSLIIFSFCAYGQNQKTEKKGKLSLVREQICINGIWDFAPITKDEAVHQEIDYGKIRVPGAWFEEAWWVNAPGIVKKGFDSNWQLDIADVSAAYYKKDFSVPERWKGKRILLEMERVSTDAVISVDDNVIDTIHWPGGTVDLSDFVQPGKNHELNILVFATASPGKYFQLMGTATTQVSMHDERLASKGITGNVFLKMLPKGPVISDVFLQTSYRKKEITTQIQIENVDRDDFVNVDIEIYDDANKKVKEFKTTKNLKRNALTKIEISEEWPNPVLWDLNQPNIYKAVVTASFKNSSDQYTQEFGFREFWISGKDFYLNGKKINLRPTSYTGPGNGMTELIDSSIVGLKKAGFNFVEIWPMDQTRRGFISYDNEFIKRASVKGLPLAAPLPPAIPYIMDKNWSFIWNDAGMKEAYEKQLLPYIKKIRNEPAIVMWTMNPNFFGHINDQNPVVIGTNNWVKENKGWTEKANAGLESIGIVKKHDPTRPVFNHHNAYVGDFQTVNLYLCFLPLQEREDWLSHFDQFGTLPFMGIEFGTPLECSMMRGRAPFHENTVSEPLFTEFACTYLGKKSYLMETPEYRNEIKNKFIEGQTYSRWQNNAVSGSLPSFQAIQELFIDNTWRSWRTYGISGGMVPWSNAHGWEITSEGYKFAEKYTDFPGREGTYFDNIRKNQLHYLAEPYWKLRKAAKSLIENNSSTLAYIAGKEGDFSSKDHSFFGGSFLKKQVIIFNDSRQIQEYNWKCMAEVDGIKIGEYSNQGEIAVASKIHFPIEFKIPAGTDIQKVDGKIFLTCTIGENTHADTFAFRVFAEQPVQPSTIHCFDPLDISAEMLRNLGMNVLEWQGEMNVPVLVIGREVLSEGFVLPASIRDYVKNGGKLLISPQNPKWMEEQMGFRMAKHLSRYVFPVDDSHPVCKNLDEHDLRNWNGNSTLVEPYPDYFNRTVKKGMYGLPYYGYHWGNRGSVSTAAIEKPHLSGWRPLLECEFDLAYSPLMELQYGKGLIMVSMLDLEDNYRVDPAAKQLSQNIINYLVDREVELKIPTCDYVGDSQGNQLLDLLGVRYKKANTINNKSEVVIFEDIHAINPRQLEKFLEKGGKAVCLYQNQEAGMLGITYTKTTDFSGGIDIKNWDILKGMSVSDIRWRTSHETWLINDGCEITAGGLIGKKEVGKGTLVLCQMNPDLFNADSATFFRYTRWRQTRAIAQLLTNLGATFNSDPRIFEFSGNQEKISLEGEWSAKITCKKGATISLISDISDEGISVDAEKYLNKNEVPKDLKRVKVPMEMEKYGDEWVDVNGEVVFMKEIYLPSSFEGNDIILNLGIISDYDITFFNGEIVGKTEKGFKDYWSHERKYVVPGKLVKKGKNIIGIRVFDMHGEGGLLGCEREMTVTLKSSVDDDVFYHPDYRDDFRLGDNPFRFFRW